MAGRIKDITGQRFGRLIPIERLEEKHKKHGYAWMCKCDCGNTTKVFLCYLTGGHTSSCGCLQIERNKNKALPYNEMTDRFKEIYDNKYSYPEYNKDNYIKQTSRIDIVCPIHGLFKREAHNHLNGSGCTECKNQELI